MITDLNSILGLQFKVTFRFFLCDVGWTVHSWFEYSFKSILLNLIVVVLHITLVPIYLIVDVTVRVAHDRGPFGVIELEPKDTPRPTCFTVRLEG